MASVTSKSRTTSKLLAVTIAVACAIAPTPVAASACGLTVGSTARSRTAALSDAARGLVEDAMRIAGADHYIRGMVLHLAGAHSAAVAEFETYADVMNTAKGRRRDEGTARAAYWAARALRDAGDATRSAVAMALAASMRGTFYGGLAEGPRALSGAWPRPGYLYIDYRTPIQLVWAVIRTESGFDPKSVSGANALGLMQVIPPTASKVATDAGGSFDRHRMLSDGHYNVAIGSTYLGQLVERYGGYLPLALAAYNAGPGCADAWVAAMGDPRREVDPLTWLESIPLDETREYVQSVLAAYRSYVGGKQE